jgi:hypothetical protein
MGNENDFYAREVGKTDLDSIITIQDIEKRSDNQMLAKSIDDFNGNEMLITGHYNQHQDIFFSLVDNLNIGCSFLRAYAQIKKINDYITRSPEELGKLKESMDNKLDMLYYAIKDYSKRIRKNLKEREFDAGDKVKVNYEGSQSPSKEYKYYCSERDKVFPRGSSGIITQMYVDSNCQVYFSAKQEYTPKNGDDIVNKHNLNTKEETKNLLKFLIPRKNSAFYPLKELRFIPPNRYELNMLDEELSKLRKIATV